MSTTHSSHPARDPLLWLFLLGFGALLGTLGIMRYLGFNADMFDLGNMAQAIASVRRGEPLVFTYSEGQFSRLALHVELFYYLLALPYAFWPDPRLLIGFQAALYALGALPAYNLGQRRLGGRRGGLAAALIYLLYPVGQTAVLLDIHGDTLAMPLLLFAIEALDRRAWRSYALWIGLALSCKFYVAAPVALMGPLIWWCYGERRAAWLTTLAGLGYGLLAFFVIRPLFTTAETSSLHRGASYLSFYFGQFDALAASAGWRLANAMVVFLPIALPLRRGWLWALPGLPIVAAALLSTLNNSAGYASHHYAIAVPFLVMAAIDGLSRLREGTGPLARFPGPPGAARPVLDRQASGRIARLLSIELGLTVVLTAALCLALVDTPLSPGFWLGAPNKGLDPSQYGLTSRDGVKERFLRTALPPEAPIAASLYTAPHLADRETLYVVRYEVSQITRSLAEILADVDYVLADALFDYRVIIPGGGFDGGAASEIAEIGQLLREPDFGLVAARDGLLLFGRDPAPGAAMSQALELLPDNGSPALASVGGLELVAADIVPLGGRRYSATFSWRRVSELPPAVIVSRLEGFPDARIVHLPSYALTPISSWPTGQIAREHFELELPAEIPAGRYLWMVGCYSLEQSEAYATDERSRLGAEHALVTIEVK